MPPARRRRGQAGRSHGRSSEARRYDVDPSSRSSGSAVFYPLFLGRVPLLEETAEKKGILRERVVELEAFLGWGGNQKDTGLEGSHVYRDTPMMIIMWPFLGA